MTTSKRTRRTRRELRRDTNAPMKKDRIDNIIRFSQANDLSGFASLALVLNTKFSLKKAAALLAMDTTNRISRTMLQEPEKHIMKKTRKLVLESNKKNDFSPLSALLAKTRNIDIQQKVLSHFIGMALGVESMWMDCPDYLKSYLVR